MVVSSVLVLLLLSISEALAEQCTSDFNNPCVAHCSNKTSLDISNLFKYPYNISGFTWSPCEGYECPNFVGGSCAVCQSADQYYCCGTNKQPIWLLNQNDPLEFQIEYDFGVQWRISFFTFKEKSSLKTTTAEFLSENPLLQYNFLVQGKSLRAVIYKRV